MRFSASLFACLILVSLFACKPQRRVSIVVTTPCMEPGQEISITGNLGLPGSNHGLVRMDRLNCDLWTIALYATPGDTICFHVRALSPDGVPFDAHGFPLPDNWCIPVADRDTIAEYQVAAWR